MIAMLATYLTGGDLLVLKVVFQCNRPSHDCGEFHIAHRAAARVRSEVFFHGLFHNPANASAEVDQSGSTHHSLDESVVRRSHVC